MFAMKLSIIIPTFNSALTLRKALDSILSQTFRDYEVLVMDGASSDDTVKIAESYGDSRIRVFSEPDKGIYDAMNKGIAKSKGEWLYFLGSDDWMFEDNTLKAVFETENIDGYDVVYGDADCSKGFLRGRGEWVMNDLDFNRCHQAIFYKRSFLIREGGYDTRYRIIADYDLNLKWFLNDRYKHKYIDLLVAHFSDGGASSNQYDGAFSKDFERIVLTRGFKKMSGEQRKVYFVRWLRKSPIGKGILSVWSILHRD